MGSLIKVANCSGRGYLVPMTRAMGDPTGDR
ncbi:MAG: hypothetical protein QOJ57_1997 [Thermoleophilaceae bacterium]|jgi:hypothetical protein|nr:hypothetical protein [Thermoleophilaceae bacterium]